MSVIRRLATALLFPLVFAAGCASEEHEAKPRGSSGGFTVLADSPGHPPATRVIADVGDVAIAHGFARLPAPQGPPADPVTRETLPKPVERYGKGALELDLNYQPSSHRVQAYLHNPQNAGEAKYIHRFFEDYHRRFASAYGEQDPISESAFSDEVRRGPASTGPDVAPGINGTRTTGLSGGAGY